MPKSYQNSEIFIIQTISEFLILLGVSKGLSYWTRKTMVFQFIILSLKKFNLIYFYLRNYIILQIILNFWRYECGFTNNYKGESWYICLMLICAILWYIVNKNHYNLLI